MILLLKEAVNSNKTEATDRGAFPCKLMIFICMLQADEAKAYSGN